jgi:hypothetical protein
MCAAACTPRIAIVPGETLKCELKYDLRGTNWPATLTLGHIEPLQKAAYVNK